MQSREEVLAFGLTFPDTYQDTPFHDQNWQLIRIKGSKKAFLWTYEMNGYIHINVKVDPEWRDFWRDAYESVIPGYHQNKEHWNTVILDGSVPDGDIKRMIAESYELIAKTPSAKIYEAVKQIPKGFVATYGDVAEIAGDRKYPNNKTFYPAYIIPSNKSSADSPLMRRLKSLSISYLMPMRVPSSFSKITVSVPLVR